jgi:mono/diheme cytochrome c family protein
MARLAFALFSLSVLAGASLPARAQAPTASGAELFRAANCVACHKWSGIGGGGYGGAAANLRKTSLAQADIESLLHCGDPGGGMPYFKAGAYDKGACNGIKKSDLDTATMPKPAAHFLNDAEIHTVAGYVVTHFKGKGDPTAAECVGFFGHETHACDGLPGDAHGTPGSPSEAPHHLQIDTAPDANAAPK